jgi:Fe-Mn family superoxide dismutase
MGLPGNIAEENAMTTAEKTRPATPHSATPRPATKDETPIALPPLPFADNALEPVISAATIGFHHGKHHKGYVDTLLKLVAGTAMADKSLETIILETVGQPEHEKIFNNAAQIWNHNFYWNSLSPVAQAPSGKLAAAIDRDFGSFDKCKQALIKVSVDQFGTGWGWLVHHGGRLKAVSTGDADVPFVGGAAPLLTVDVWEHAYYLDWQNKRPDHVKALVDGHLNWEFAARNFAAT